jgi:carbamoyl-phosphate synthase large subunit
MKVAVTGVGGGVGQSVMKALSIATLPVQICAIDVQPLSAGLYRAREATVLPRPEMPGALAEWEAWLVEHKIEALIPGSDHDLAPLAAVREEWAARKVCQVLVSDMDLVRICRDKALTTERLLKANLPAPRSTWALSLEEAVTWAAGNGYPVILKPRDGFASRGVQLIADEEELRFYFPRTPNAMLQEYLSLGKTVEEFTCAVFVDRDGQPIGTFMARRDLASGATYRAEVNAWPELNELLLAIGAALRPRGPMNVQLRLTERGPVPFELNIRCSGTAAIRAHFGYNEPEMLLRHYVLGEALPAPTVRHGYAFRYWNEVFVEGATREQLVRGDLHLQGEIRTWP